MSEAYIGEMRLFAGNYAPEGWALCLGQALAIKDYEDLFALIGTAYGGDGRSTFCLPNLAARLPVGRSDSVPPGMSHTYAGWPAVSLPLASWSPPCRPTPMRCMPAPPMRRR